MPIAKSSGQTSTPNALLVDTSKSQHALMSTLPISAVTLRDTFWMPKLNLLATVTLPTQFALLKAEGRLDNFLRAAGKLEKPFQGVYYFNDSDVSNGWKRQLGHWPWNQIALL